MKPNLGPGSGTNMGPMTSIGRKLTTKRSKKRHGENTHVVRKG